MKPEQKARKQIDEQLQAAGWAVQSRDTANLGAAHGVAVGEFPLTTGFADYMLFVDRRPIGVVEAKAVGKTLSGVEVQTVKHSEGLPPLLKANVLFYDRKPASATPWTQTLWIYDLRTNMNFTLKQNPLTREDLDDFVACYNPANRHERTPTWMEDAPDGRWRAFSYEELMARDKVNLDIFWLRDESLEETANLPDPDVLAAEIVDDLEAALEQFRAIAEDLGEE
jgi:hypothetical protein